MTTPPPDHNSQILIKLGEMGAQLAVMNERLTAVPDHENRIRSLERWRYGLPLAGVLAIGSTAISIYAALH